MDQLNSIVEDMMGKLGFDQAVIDFLKAFAQESVIDKEGLFFFYGYLHGLYKLGKVDDTQRLALIKSITYFYYAKKNQLENMNCEGTC